MSEPPPLQAPWNALEKLKIFVPRLRRRIPSQFSSFKQLTQRCRWQGKHSPHLPSPRHSKLIVGCYWDCYRRVELPLWDQLRFIKYSLRIRRLEMQNSWLMVKRLKRWVDRNLASIQKREVMFTDERGESRSRWLHVLGVSIRLLLKLLSWLKMELVGCSLLSLSQFPEISQGRFQRRRSWSCKFDWCGE